MGGGGRPPPPPPNLMACIRYCICTPAPASLLTPPLLISGDDFGWKKYILAIIFSLEKELLRKQRKAMLMPDIVKLGISGHPWVLHRCLLNRAPEEKMKQYQC